MAAGVEALVLVLSIVTHPRSQAPAWERAWRALYDSADGGARLCLAVSGVEIGFTSIKFVRLDHFHNTIRRSWSKLNRAFRQHPIALNNRPR